MEQNQYALVWDEIILGLVWADNVIEAGVLFTRNGLLSNDLTETQPHIMNMTRLLEAEGANPTMVFPDSVTIMTA